MKPTDTSLTTRLGVLAVALAVLLSAFAPVAAIPQPDGTVGIQQSAGGGTVAPGETITVETTVNATGYNAPALAVTLPDGWTITSQSADGPATYKSSTNEWVWLSGGEYDVTYTVQVPVDASTGDGVVEAVASAIDPSTDEFVENAAQTTVSVAAADESENQPPTAVAGLDQTVEEGDSVTLDATGSSDLDGDDLSYDWTQTDGPDLTLADASSATPSFTAPDVDADETLTFEVEVSDGEETATDDVTVTVEDTDEADPPGDEPPATVGLSVGQTAQSDVVAPDETMTIDATIDATGTNAPALDVTLPDGWTITSQSAEGPVTFKPSTNEWVWLSGGEYDVTYTVQVPADTAADDYTITADGSAIDPSTDEFVEATAGTTITVAAAEEEPPADAPPTEVSLSPSEELVGVDGSTTFDLIVDDVDGGVGAYAMTIAVEDSNVASISDVELAGASNMELTDVQIASDGSTATIEAALIDTADSGNAPIGTVTVQGTADGESDVTVAVSNLGTESGAPYEVTGTNPATLTVSELVVGGADQPAKDPDDDGVYEDVNGDGTVDELDVQLLFTERDSATVQGSPDAFDFNGDGEFDILDVQALYNKEVA
ncbi:PKD domain-containing protein [Halobellus marinus]|uniref:PKD domain-containing protein n=1 Tax=Halobellus TaxID=1073986 RepID=UPI0028B26303|nr:dockerin type I domain-containing protein [Halobellus sp. DFY28]